MSRQTKLVILTISLVIMIVLLVFICVPNDREETGQEALSPTQERVESDDSLDFEDLDEADSIDTNDSEKNKGTSMDHTIQQEGAMDNKEQSNTVQNNESKNDNQNENNEAEDIFEIAEDINQGYGPIH